MGRAHDFSSEGQGLDAHFGVPLRQILVTKSESQLTKRCKLFHVVLALRIRIRIRIVYCPNI